MGKWAQHITVTNYTSSDIYQPMKVRWLGSESPVGGSCSDFKTAVLPQEQILTTRYIIKGYEKMAVSSTSLWSSHHTVVSCTGSSVQRFCSWPTQPCALRAVQRCARSARGHRSHDPPAAYMVPPATHDNYILCAYKSTRYDLDPRL